MNVQLDHDQCACLPADGVLKRAVHFNAVNQCSLDPTYMQRASAVSFTYSTVPFFANAAAAICHSALATHLSHMSSSTLLLLFIHPLLLQHGSSR